ncbi:hypothetical protein H257_18999 [Aphanomyces astaci]|uniref:BED-type domain-containing protein n=1 Tax=Aphanomyces astaci TaxID=112090 RepID=W4FAY1_APHAT|nr:hypothetical protein H257_18999 [Aphanomyces astaci]ETV64059.1 hypothetical protein H257_18999 [Aphanomyces astaci]|eukprot:XP_009846458.1 hypothetical protein H257_18999 [Aphanomyces astaci]
MMSTFLSGKSTTPKFSPEQCSRYFFSAITDSNDETTGRWRCTLCQRTYTQQEGRGYTNLLAHLKASHSNYAAHMREAPAAAQSTNTRLWVSDRVKGRFGWISWIVEEGLPVATAPPCNFSTQTQCCALRPRFGQQPAWFLVH